MALGDNYCTAAELKTRLRVTDANDDTLIQAAVETASRQVERYCRRQFNDAGVTSSRVYYATSRTLAMVDDFHTTTGLVIATDTTYDGTYANIWPDTAYLLEPLNGVHGGTTGWPYWRIRAVEAEFFGRDRRPGLQVTARWGWASVPAPIKEGTLALAEELFKMKDSPYGIAGMGEFGFVRIRENPKIVSLLMNYRRDAVRVR